MKINEFTLHWIFALYFGLGFDGHTIASILY